MTTPNQNRNEDQHDLLKQVAPPFKETKEDIWAKMQKDMEVAPEPEAKVVRLFPAMKYAVAAAVALAVSTTLFCRLYTSSIISLPGQQLSYTLPDGSLVSLNAASSISYHPYWWSVSRELEFEGEAFFEVEKGSNFSVNSAQGVTEVLGTSFNINTRDEGYTVICKTGKVRVSSTQSDAKVVITPNMIAELKANQQLLVKENIDLENYLGWREAKFIFTSVALDKVFQEIEIQYDVKIKNNVANPNQMKYTGNFPKSKSVETTLNFICQSFGISFVRQSDNTYVIDQ